MQRNNSRRVQNKLQGCDMNNCHRNLLRLAMAGALDIGGGRFAAQEMPPLDAFRPRRGPLPARTSWARRRRLSHQFLRQDSVLLKPGEWQLDTGLNYTVYDHYFTGLVVNGVTIAPVDTRMPPAAADALGVPLRPVRQRASVRQHAHRLDKHQEIRVSLAAKPKTTPEASATQPGFSWLVHKSDGCSCDPDIMATFGFTAPTGNGNFLEELFLTPETTLGQGFWYGYWNVMFIHTYDPIIIFYGFGSRHGFSRDLDEINVHPGDQYSYRPGSALPSTSESR